ncbi:MAG: Uma2 family endonuclease [Candidatus Ornithomonoglobus sp.]
MALLKEEAYTVDFVKTLSDGERAELSDGNIYYMAPPSSGHQKISMFLSYKISDYIAGNNGSCQVFAAPFGVFLNDDEYNYFEPDISVICNKDKVREDGCHGAPDWIIEIVSRSSKHMDYLIKLNKYQQAGVREYWIIDPERNLVITYDFENDNVENYSLSDRVKTYIYSDFEINFSEMK